MISNTEFLIAVLICLILGLLMFLCGWLIWKKKKLGLIAGFQESEFKGDKEKLAKDMGIFSIFIGVIVIALPFGLQYIGEWVAWLFTIVIFVSSIFIVIKINFRNK
ncbi:DUF3784 domain-containing protein [Viridibacillus sp. NPDC096237]|uniref:DUF3784 domain-containing protein n=1 Tax=Viridibacillus sp. NPDC096237 TaxID=3390721 RepID=UPI003D0425D0